MRGIDYAVYEVVDGAPVARRRSKCGVVKPVAAFGPRKDRPGGRVSWCRTCSNGHMVKHRRKRLGVSPARYDEMVRLRDGRCDICGQPERDRRGRGLNVDHDADTGVVRGLLCTPCNTAIGLLADDPARLEAAIHYLRRASL